MIYFSDFDAGGSPSLGVGTIAVQDFTTGTGTGTQSYTTFALTGVTPTCAIIMGNYHQVSTEPTEGENFSHTIGFLDASNNRVAVGINCDDNVTTGGTTGHRIGSSAASHVLTGGVGTRTGVGTLVSGGVEINWTASSGQNERGAFMALAGIGNARVGTIALGTGTSAIDVTAPGFEPDVVFFIGVGGGMAASGGDTVMTFGVATADNSQRCVALAEYRSAVSTPYMAILTDCAAADIDFTNGALLYKVVSSAFDASGFSVTPSASAALDSIGYMAVDLGGGRCKIVDLTTPTSTGNQAVTGAGFTPRAAIIVLTNLEAVNPSFPLSTSSQQGGFAMGLVADETWAAGARIKSGGSPQDTACNFSNKAIIGPSDASCNAAEAALVSLDGDGMTLNWSSVQGTAKKGFILFIE